MRPSTRARGTKPAPELHTVAAITPDCRIVLSNGATVSFLGLEDPGQGRGGFLPRGTSVEKEGLPPGPCAGDGDSLRARIILKNRISVNAQLVKAGAARAVDSPGR